MDERIWKISLLSIHEKNKLNIFHKNSESLIFFLLNKPTLNDHDEPPQFSINQNLHRSSSKLINW